MLDPGTGKTNIGRVLRSIQAYVQVLLEIQLQKAKVAGIAFDIEEFSRLKEMMVGRYAWESHPFPEGVRWGEGKEGYSNPYQKFTGKSEVEIVEAALGSIESILNAEKRLERHLLAVFAHATRADSELYGKILKSRGMERRALEADANARAILGSLFGKGLAREQGGMIVACPLNQLPFEQLRYFLALLSAMRDVQKAFEEPSLKNKRLLFLEDSMRGILEGERKSFGKKDDQPGDYSLFLEWYAKEKAHSFRVFIKMREWIDEDLKLAHALHNPLFQNMTNHSNYLLSSAVTAGWFHISTLINVVMLGKNVDSILYEKKLKGRVSRNAVSGLTETYPGRDEVISSAEKETLRKVSHEISAHPQRYFLPAVRDVPFSFSGGILKFPTGYRDRFFGMGKRAKGEVYASYMPGKFDGSVAKRAVLIFPPKRTPAGTAYHIQRALASRGISSLAFVVPEQEIRQTQNPANQDALESMDPVFSASIYGSIEQVLQTSGDAMIALDWLQTIGHRSFAVYGQSQSTAFSSILMAMDPRIELGVWVLPGSDAAELAFTSAAAPHVRAMYEGAGVNEQELKEFWGCFASFPFIERIAKVDKETGRDSKAYIVVAKHDKTIPYTMQKALAKKIEATVKRCKIKEVQLPHLETLVSLAIFPRQVVEYIDENLGRLAKGGLLSRLTPFFRPSPGAGSPGRSL